MASEKKLLRLKQQIEDTKVKVSELKGKKSANMDSLKKNWGCNSLDEGVVKLQELKQSISDLKSKIDTGIRKLQKQYDL